jgi:hypothetical protein
MGFSCELAHRWVFFSFLSIDGSTRKQNQEVTLSNAYHDLVNAGLFVHCGIQSLPKSIVEDTPMPSYMVSAWDPRSSLR